mmetsp:Transcript_4427/g.13512  ORF Transcript_4427/g.13512 Transcript_4427/m.13512 type:complete len:1245 (-) Transcript_4427:26-3760(-)
MHIKQVTLHGFKTYKNETICDPFHPRHNVIVGRNGSGKSNFLFAIRFVLSDMFSTLSNQERAKLLHGEGVGMAVMSAYVEITFDNADHRIPIERDEVALRRTIGLKKDEYHLDTKHVSKQDVMNLLESSGFSRSNPYYIVQQGKIMKLTAMKDAERLNLLKEVAGTKVYDERRKQSVEILNDTTSKKERIEEVLSYIEERLGELEDEKEELKEYQDLDRAKRAIEYTIYDKELRNVRQTLDRIDEERHRVAEEREQAHEAGESDRANTSKLTADLRQLEREREKMSREKGEIEEERSEHLKNRAKLEFEVSEAEAHMGDEETNKSRMQTELKSVQEEKARKMAELERLNPELKKATSDTAQVAKDYEIAQRKRDDLFGKQTRTTQFRTVEERNKFLDDEIKSLHDLTRGKTKLVKHAQSEVDRLKEFIKTSSDDVKDQIGENEDRHKMVTELQSQLVKMRDERAKLQDDRQQAWKKESILDTRKTDLKKEVSESERALFSTTAKHTTKGIEAMREFKRMKGVSGIHGPLYDLVSCKDEYRSAVEATGGNQFFSIVVDTDEVASACIDYMNDQNIDARLTFLPLNRLRKTPHALPQGKEVIHLHKKVTVKDERLLPALYHVFGSSLLCRDMAIANEYSNKHDVDTVTLDGDKVARKGAMTGGYVDDRVSKLEMAKKLRDCARKLHQVEEEGEKMKKVLDEIDDKGTHMESLKTKRTADRDRLRATIEETTKSVEYLEAQIATATSNLADKEKSIEQFEKELSEITDKIQGMEQAKEGALDSQLAEDDRELLQELTEELAKLQPQMAECQAREEALRKKSAVLTNAITIHLDKQERKLARQVKAYAYEDNAEKFSSKNAELSRANSVLAESEQRQKELSAMLSEKKSAIAEIQKALEGAKAEERKRVSSDADADKELEKILSRRAQNLAKRDRLYTQIRELGALPKGFEEHSNTSVKVLYKKLAAVNKKLKDPKYRQVNKKALDQYVSFSEQRDALTSRKGDQDTADASIKDLIQVLDNQKDEAIARTFKQVSKYFSEVFSELVPNGEAQLIMQTRMDEPEAGEAEELESEDDGAAAAAADDVESSEAESDVDSPPRKKGGKKGKAKAAAKDKVAADRKIENYVGVAVRVSFTGQETETQLLQQLSGGQKTIVALALIFAIQRCDPAPFYLFDEIDAALDAAYRVAVADMIHRLSEKAQFITTTFRPEMLAHANRFYGVTFHKKVSKIDCVSQANAMAFLEDVTTK